MSDFDVDDLPERLREIVAMDRSDFAAAAGRDALVSPGLRGAGQGIRRPDGAGLEPASDIGYGKPGDGAGIASAMPGTHLIREWSGRTYRVEVTDAGYVLDSMIYRMGRIGSAVRACGTCSPQATRLRRCVPKQPRQRAASEPQGATRDLHFVAHKHETTSGAN